MSPKARPIPTEAELAVLRVLWRVGSATVRDVHEELYRGTSIGYTTTLKLLQNLLAKSLVRRDGSARQHRYRAAVEAGPTIGTVVRQFVDRSFDGSAAQLALHALGARTATADELAQVKALIVELEREGGR